MRLEELPSPKKLPYKFKTAANWKVFVEVMDNYLGQLMGSSRVPLKYVVRFHGIASPDAVYERPQAQMIVLAPLIGDSYNRDNSCVYGIIKQLVLEGPGQTYIMCLDETFDGRST
jgi:hypothetical protein